MSRAAGILFLDEITNISRPDVKSVTYKLLLDRKVGYIKFHPDVLVVAAGNPAEFSAIAEGFTAPQANRMIIMHLKQPTVDSWAAWNDKTFGADGWDKVTYGFLKAFEADNYLLQVPRDPEVEHNFPSPRSWSILSTLLKRGIREYEVIEGLLGPEVAGKFRAFMSINVDIEELIREPEKWKDLVKLDAKYMACLMLANWIEKHRKDIEKAFPLIDRMTGERHEYLVFTAKVLSSRVRVEFLQRLFRYNSNYQRILSDIAIVLKQKISK